MFPTRERLSQLLAASILLLNLGSAFAAQAPSSSSGLLHGTVTDPAGAAIVGASVEITNLKTAALRKARTDASGRFEAASLAPGTYSVKVVMAGFRTTTRESIDVDGGTAVPVDVRPEIAPVGSPMVMPPDSPRSQPASSNALTDGRGTWELGAFLGGGTGAGKSSNTQFLYAGGRAGLVLTPDLFTNTPIRGNLEYAVEIMPVYTVFTPNGAVYGASIKPFLVQWNFTKPQRFVPYIHIGGGVLFSTSDVPPPDTSSINFTPQIGGGIRWFHRRNRSIDFSLDVVHHSNASLGDHNPGYNASVFFTVGYSWYKPRH